MNFIRLAYNQDLFHQIDCGSRDKLSCYHCHELFNPYGVDESQFLWFDADSPRSTPRHYCTKCKNKEYQDWLDRRSRRSGLYS